MVPHYPDNGSLRSHMVLLNGLQDCPTLLEVRLSDVAFLVHSQASGSSSSLLASSCPMKVAKNC